MSTPYLFVGGPAHGKTIAVREEHTVRIPLPPAPWLLNGEPTDEIPTEVCTYVRQTVFAPDEGDRMWGPMTGYVRHVMAPVGWPLDRIEKVLRDFIWLEWVKEGTRVE